MHSHILAHHMQKLVFSLHKICYDKRWVFSCHDGETCFKTIIGCIKQVRDSFNDYVHVGSILTMPKQILVLYLLFPAVLTFWAFQTSSSAYHLSAYAIYLVYIQAMDQPTIIYTVYTITYIFQQGVLNRWAFLCARLKILISVHFFAPGLYHIYQTSV